MGDTMKVMRTAMHAALLAGAVSLATGCGKKEATPAPGAAPAAEAPTAEATETPAAPPRRAPSLDGVDFKAVADAAVADSRRPAEDRADDARRKAAESLVFMRLAPGLSVFEVEAGGGWYTELLAHAVGPSGKVFMQNPPSFMEFVGEKVAARLQDGRLANVTETISNFDELESQDASVDLVTWVHGPHELYFTPSEGVTLGDPAGSYAEIYRILKPGGSFVVIDHAAKPGSDESTGDTLHRIDKAIVVTMAKTAGFRLVDESAFLANPKDDHTRDVFDEKIKGYTDQFSLRFVKD